VSHGQPLARAHWSTPSQPFAATCSLQSSCCCCCCWRGLVVLIQVVHMKQHAMRFNKQKYVYIGFSFGPKVPLVLFLEHSVHVGLDMDLM
jgi:hypothetical protein